MDLPDEAIEQLRRLNLAAIEINDIGYRLVEISTKSEYHNTSTCMRLDNIYGRLCAVLSVLNDIAEQTLEDGGES